MPGLTPDPNDALYRKLRDLESRLAAVENRRRTGHPVFAAHSSASASYTTSHVKLNFAVEDFDSHDAFDLTTDVYTVPYTGEWRFDVSLPQTSAGSVGTWVRLIPSNLVGPYHEWYATLGADTAGSLWTIVYLEAGDDVCVSIEPAAGFTMTSRAYMTWRVQGELLAPVTT